MNDHVYPNHPVDKRHQAWIAATAVLIGQVVLGDNVQVHYNSVIRADDSQVVIGDHSVVLENCFITSSPLYQVWIGSRVTVGHQATLEGCTVHDCVVIGEAARVLKGAVLGQGSMIDPGAVVPQNSIIPPNTRFSGLPGHPPRELTAE